MQVGDHIVSQRDGYAHHGIYVGNGNVIHYAGLAEGLRAGPVEMVSIKTFEQGYRATVVKHPNRLYDRKQTVKRARSKLGEDNYNVVLNNCEHFANWCIEGERKSNQVRKAVVMGSLVLLGIRVWKRARRLIL